MVIKIDLEKAYDRLSWKFIQETLIAAEFNGLWVRNIMTCITTSRLAITLNGERTDWFKPSRGIRQGDQISPLIFVLCIERLSQLISSKVVCGEWRGMKLSKDGPTISHLLLADDMVLFGEATIQQAKIMKHCSDGFCTKSGQRVNYQKSAILFSKNTPIITQTNVAELLNIPKTEDLGRYLGVSSLHGRLKNDSFDSLIKKIQGRLAGWRRKTLSLAGRRILIQSVLSSIPLYTMQTTLFPTSVIKAIEKIFRNFLWGGTVEERKCSLVAWSIVTQDRENGSLGIRKLDDMNTTLLAKLGWQLQSGKEGLWQDIMRGKYATPNLDPSTWKPKQNTSNAWKEILKTIPLLKKGTTKVFKNRNSTLFC